MDLKNSLNGAYFNIKYKIGIIVNEIKSKELYYTKVQSIQLT